MLASRLLVGASAPPRRGLPDAPVVGMGKVSMSSKQVLTAIVLVSVCSWSAVMAALGQLAAVAALVPSLGLLVQQVVHASACAKPESTAAAPAPAAGRDEGAAR